MPPRRKPTAGLLVRPGARFACTAHGLCCTDMHALGPLFPGDLVRLHRRRPDGTMRHPRLDVDTIRTDERGTCVFLSEGRCSLHGTDDKPRLCHRFPFGAVVTPAGTRITTAHRCTCRTLGERAPIDPVEAARSLSDERGNVALNAVVGKRVPLTSRTTVSFERYVAAEATWIERLASGEPPADVLEVDLAWPVVDGPSWLEVGEALRSAEALGTGGDHLLAWFGHALLALAGREDAPPARPWAQAFDVAERGAAVQRAPDAVLGDFLADALWDMRWTLDGGFDRFATHLLLRHAVASQIARELTALGARADRAAAEGVTIVEIAGESQPWQRALAGARRLPVRLPGVGRAT